MVWLRKLIPLLGILILFSCNGEKTTIQVLTASGLKKAFNPLVEKYQKEHPKVNVKVIYGGSGNLLALLKEKHGDIFIPAGDYYIKKAEEWNLIEPNSVKVLTEFVPVLVVKNKFSQRIKSLKDLTKVDIKIGIGDPRAASVGKVGKLILEKAGIWNLVKDKISVKTPTVSQLLVYLKTGQIDGAIIWKHLVKNLKGFKVIPIQKQYLITEKVEITIAKFSKNKRKAEDFENFIFQNKEVLEKGIHSNR